MVKNVPADTADMRDMSLIPRLGRSPGGGHGNPLQCSCLENPMDRGAWQAKVRRVTKSWTRTLLKRLSTQAPIRVSPPSWASPPPLLPPTQVITERQAGLPVLHSTFSPAIYFTHGSICVSMPFSPFVPPLSPHCVLKSVFFIWVHSFPENRIPFNTIFLDSLYMC